MKRPGIFVSALLLLAFVGCASASAASERAAKTELRITVSPKGEDHPSVRYTLRCRPAGGSLPEPQRACRLLASLHDPFAPVPKGTPCTMIYGGPQVATVRGIFRGKRVRARFNRLGGCEIARWERVRFLFRTD